MNRPDTGLSLPGTAPPLAPRPSSEVREMLSQAGDLAGRNERANRPHGLLTLSISLLTLGLICVGWYAVARTTQASRLEREREKAGRIETMVERLAAFDRVNVERMEELRPLVDFQTRTNEAATAARLTNKLPVVTATVAPGGVGDLQRRVWRYTDIREESLERLFDWIARCLRSAPGLELTGLTIRPDANNWRIDVSFGRWERKGS